tara:strand:- start:98 stop:394 length:297 start_codon:yes stop_codon:yes gene_type:complete
MMKKIMLLLVFSISSTSVVADAIEMRDYITIRTGMSEAEILYKFGPSDHETIRSDRLDFVLSKTWFYIPIRSSNDKWITEIKFDSNGKLIKRDRYRVR